MPLYTEFITVRENKRASLERVCFLSPLFCIERHNSHTVRALNRTRTIICCQFQSTLILSCLAYAFGMLQGGLLMCDRGGYEMWWDKKSILLMPFVCCKMNFFTLCLLSRSRLRLFLCRQALLLR